MKKVTLVLITLTFAYACVSLWAMLTALGNVAAHSAMALPAFSRFLIGLRTGLLLLPIPVAGFCLYALLRRPHTESTPTTFLACTMSLLCLVCFPVLIALFLPSLKLIEQVK